MTSFEYLKVKLAPLWVSLLSHSVDGSVISYLCSNISGEVTALYSTIQTLGLTAFSAGTSTVILV